MIIVRLKGGLGNQMFQYAAARRLAEVTKQPLKMDLDFLLNGQKKEEVTQRSYSLSIFNIHEEFATEHEVRQFFNFQNKVLHKVLGANWNNCYVKERFFHFDSRLLYLRGSRYLDGHWMSEKYFKDIASILRKEFSFRINPTVATNEILKKISKSNSVCLHVRRGDYLSSPSAKKIYNTLGLDYYVVAIQNIITRIPNPSFFVFSDDIDWCEKELYFLQGATFVEKELEGTGAIAQDYFYLMTFCKHFIISNSTYGWWAAWLGQNKHKVIIAPKKWFINPVIQTEDIYPDTWNKL